MEKEKIMIRRIKEGTFIEKEDEVAVEHQLNITMKNGEEISVTCTPTYLEEMILARRFLTGDLSAEELEGQTEEVLKSVRLSDIFRIAKESFENPGTLFAATGCAHSCALISDEGKVLCHIEDIGRHNALDKVIGFAIKHKISISKSCIFSSGRISGDYLEKAIAAGFKIVVSRAAVTKSAVELAKREKITMLGFIRKNTGNIYNEGAVSIK